MDIADDKNKNVVVIYNEIAEEYAKNYDPIDGEEDLIFPNTFLSHLNLNSYIVDIGCGTGFSAGYFIKKGMRAEGCDLSSNMIAIAKRNYPSIKFSISDMREFKPEQTADAVWAGYCLFHFGQNDFEKTIEMVKTYLKPGGVFGLVMQEGSGEVEIPEPFRPDKKIYIHLYTESELSDILARHGFKVIDQKKKTACIPNEFSYNKLLVIARMLK